MNRDNLKIVFDSNQTGSVIKMKKYKAPINHPKKGSVIFCVENNINAIGIITLHPIII
jgi:hypothetical protein